MENVYKICFYGGLILAILFLIATIVLFVVLKIPKVIGDLTGSTARKTMKEMKEGTVTTGGVAKKEQEKYYNMGTGKITVKESKSSMEERRQSGNDSTELLGDGENVERDEDATDILRPGMDDYKLNVGEETEVLSGADETDEEATDVLHTGDDGETDVLATDTVGDDGETDVLTTDTVGDDGETDVLTTDTVGDDDDTDVLTSDTVGDDGDTDVLTTDMEDEGATDILREDDTEDATDILREDDDEEGTSVLSSNMTSALAKKVKVIYNIVEVHSDESIDIM
ncbi:MAG: hypothetical protein ACI4L2_03955 [Wujia sp.]